MTTYYEVPAHIARTGVYQVAFIRSPTPPSLLRLDLCHEPLFEARSVKMQRVEHSDWRVIPGWWGYLAETDTLYWAVNRELAEAGWKAAQGEPNNLTTETPP